MSTAPSLMNEMTTNATNALAATPSLLLANWPLVIGVGVLNFASQYLDAALPRGTTVPMYYAWRSLSDGISTTAKYLYLNKAYP